MQKTILTLLILLLSLYIIACIVLYFIQERFLFFPEKLAKDYKFKFNQKFEEISIKTPDNILLNGLLFKAKNPKGIILYLHGNAGALNSWGEIANLYTDLNYDVFMLDYRGYGKSEGQVISQKQLFEDAQLVYDYIKNLYAENNIIVLGYSMGTGMATKLAATNKPKLLILQAPYFSLEDVIQHTVSIIPSFLIRYKMPSNTFIKDCTMPIVVFHGTEDKVIYYNSSVKLKALMKPTDTLITLQGEGHNSITDNSDYQAAITKLLNQY